MPMEPRKPDPTSARTSPRKPGEKSGAPQDPDRHLAREDEDEATTHPLNPPPERRSQRRAQRDERPGS